MGLGSGKYAEVIEAICDGLECAGIVLVVAHKAGREVHLDLEVGAPESVVALLPDALRRFADRIERDAAVVVAGRERGAWREEPKD